MRNVTLAIPEKDLQRARVRAARDGTSVNEVIRKYLKEYGSREDRMRKAIEELIEIAEKSQAILGGKFDRDEIHVRNPSRGW